MPDERKPLQNFNLETMSGIYPGSRTMTYQRLYLHSKDAAQPQWYQLQWYSEPPVALLRQIQANKILPEPDLTLARPSNSNFVQRFHSELTHVGLKADACYICRHWQPQALRTEDGLPAGRCGWSDAENSLPAALATQSALSLACEHFQRLEEPNSSPNDVHMTSSQPPVRNSAALDPDRLPFWPRLWRRFRRSAQPARHWADEIIERSGVGAGTEPCFVCHGRLANLGAMAVSSAEGDKQTLSVWRCRACYTTYFNDWTDRWERLESLETEESYYRIAPAEAYAALHIIHSTQGGEHPGRRADRRQQRAQILALVSGKQPLSHQFRQGR